MIHQPSKYVAKCGLWALLRKKITKKKVTLQRYFRYV